MPRTALRILLLPLDRLVRAAPHQTIDVNHGIVIALEGATSFYLQVSNAGSGRLTVIIRDGNPEFSPASGGGGESVQVAPGENQFLGPFAASRFTQAGDSVWLDFGADAAGLIAAFRPA